MGNMFRVLIGVALLAGSVNPLRATTYSNYSFCGWYAEVLENHYSGLTISGAPTVSCPMGVRCQKTTKGTTYCYLNPSCVAQVNGFAYGQLALTPQSGGGQKIFSLVPPFGYFAGNGGSVQLNTPGRGDIKITSCQW